MEYQTIHACRTTERRYRIYQGVKYWLWSKRGYYVSQRNGVQSLLHQVLWNDRVGKIANGFIVFPIDGDYDNLNEENWGTRQQGMVRRKKTKNPSQEFNGVVFYRKPEGYFKSDYKRDGGKLLHREVWIYHNGEIPQGYHIHHIDEDKANNSIENLQLISASDHSKEHGKTNPWVGSEENKRQLLSVNDKSKEWHASEAGKKWHAEHGKKTWENRISVKKNCIICNTEFSTPYPTRKHTCSRKCYYSDSINKKQQSETGL